MICNDIIESIRSLCPEHYAADWDNTGLLAGDITRPVSRIVLALDATDEAIEYAVSQRADLLLTHHPMIFSPVRSVTNETLEGRRIIRLIENKITCYASHTNFDVCCMADVAARMIGMQGGQPLELTGQMDGKPAGFGRVSRMKDRSVREWARDVKRIFGLDYVIVYGDLNRMVQNVAISPGSGKGMLGEALERNVELLITGDIGHHDAIDAVAQKVCIIDAGHYGLEHIYMQYMKNYLADLCEKAGVELLIFEQGCPGQIIWE